jgi:undecaprenyl-diphosphatase
MTILQAAILGLVQGLSEFLPISSSGHLILAQSIMGIANQSEAPVLQILDILLHAGTLIAVIVIFWKDWMAILRNLFKSKTLLLLIIASVPALIVALVFNNLLESLFSGWFVGFAFLITGAFMLLAEKLSKRGRKHVKRAEEPGYKHAVSMGVMQAVALLPGVSRSGSTLLGGIASGLTRESAAKFSFMMSAPAILGSLLIKGKSALENGYFQQLDLVPVMIGMLAAAVSGFLAIRFMLSVINRISLGWFALYVAILGVAVIVLQLAMPGFLQLPAFFGSSVNPLS